MKNTLIFLSAIIIGGIIAWSMRDMLVVDQFFFSAVGCIGIFLVAGIYGQVKFVQALVVATGIIFTSTLYQATQEGVSVDKIFFLGSIMIISLAFIASLVIPKAQTCFWHSDKKEG